MFQVGESVVHPGHGGCVIDGISVKDWAGREKSFYLLRPILDEQCQVFIPVDNAEAIGIRRVISAEIAEEILDGLQTLDIEWQPNFKKRKDQCSSVLKSNDARELSYMVKAYMCSDSLNQASSTDKELFTVSKKKLVSELALALGANTIEMEKTVADRVKSYKMLSHA